MHQPPIQTFDLSVGDKEPTLSQLRREVHALDTRSARVQDAGMHLLGQQHKPHQQIEQFGVDLISLHTLWHRIRACL